MTMKAFVYLKTGKIKDCEEIVKELKVPKTGADPYMVLYLVLIYN
jgi:hypothetical protein